MNESITKTKITVPENWSEVKVKDFQELQLLSREDSNYDVNLVSILCDLDPSYVERLDLQTYTKILINLQWITKLPTKADYKPIIEIRGEKYGLAKMSSFTNGEWYSLEHWMESPWENLHKILAMIYRPLITAINDDYRLIEDYNSETAVARAELFKDLSVADAYGAILFFSIIEKQSMQTMKEYLEIKIVMERIPMMGWMRKRLLKKKLTKWGKGNGHGIPFFTDWQKVISQKFQKS